MNPLIKLIQINHSFQKSVNLQLDLDNYERIGSYIPTRSSIAILKRYWNIVSGKSGESASVLIGPYGKGKSHLLLVLLALLHGSMERDQVILGKIEKIDPQLTEEIRQWIKQGNKYLPVLVNSVSGTDLNQSFIYALQQALNRDSDLFGDFLFSKLELYVWSFWCLYLAASGGVCYYYGDHTGTDPVLLFHKVPSADFCNA